MKYKGFQFLWYDFWVGFFYDQKKRILYFCPLPCFVFKWEAVEQKRAPDELACDDIYHDFLLQWEEVKYCDVCGAPIRR